LGSTADVVESRLEKNFALASRWGCILLIDEADVFLEARQTENFDRNSLVAGMSPAHVRIQFLHYTLVTTVFIMTVFLRTLEYYNGILFLTTNRVGTFDEAFTSRIHISLYYPPLSQASTLAVFQVNLTRIQARFQKKKSNGEATLEIDDRSINEFILRYYEKNTEARWNGRQIRNACQTALALAEFEAQKLANPAAGGRSVMDVAAMSQKMINVCLTSKHFRDVARSYLAFMRYLKEVHGDSPAQQAKNFRLRHDRYGLAEPPSLFASRQQRMAEERGPSYRQRYQSGSAGSSRGHHDQQGRGSTYRQPRQGDYMEDEKEIGTYGYDGEDCYSQESGHDPTQYGVNESDFEEEPLYEQENGRNPDLKHKQTTYEYPEELEDDDEFIQQDSDRKTRVKVRGPPGPSLRGRQGQLHPRGAEHVRVGVGGRGAGTIPLQRLSNSDGQASIRRGNTPARGRGIRHIPQRRVRTPECG
jgi:SpoVK/Ycf46/Vps4 family AAA+-type ATPase